MSYYNPPPDDEQNPNDETPTGGDDIPASVAFMEMMRQAARKQNPPQATSTPPPHPTLPNVSQPKRIRRTEPYTSTSNEDSAPPAPVDEVEPLTPAAPAPLPPQQGRRVRRAQRRQQQRATFIGGALRLLIIVPLAAALVATIFAWFTPPSTIQSGVRDELSAAQATDTFATFQPTSQPTPNWLKQIGVVSGHRGPQDDPGAVCTDAGGNLLPPTENEINFSVADRVVNNLRNMGYSVDLLDEFDPRLNNYQAAALVSIHANTCQEWPGGEIVSGFLIAGPSARASMRGNDELLVGCIAQYYGAMTGMERRAGVTIDMTDYHNFREIHPQTPAAIIELGFMLADRPLLTEQPDLMAQAIINGILCFIEPALAPTVPAPSA